MRRSQIQVATTRPTVMRLSIHQIRHLMHTILSFLFVLPRASNNSADSSHQSINMRECSSASFFFIYC